MVYNLRKKKHSLPQNEPDNDDSGSEEDLEETDSEDEEYDPDATESEEESDDGSEEDVDLEMIDFSELGKNYRFGSSAPSILFICPPHKRKQYDEDETEDETDDEGTKVNLIKNKKYSKEEKEYLKNLNKDERARLMEIEYSIGNSVMKDIVPLRFKILSSQMEDGIKRIVLNKLNNFSYMSSENSEYFKLKQWLENVANLPFQKYHKIPITKEDPPEKIISFMNNTKHILDTTVYGHATAKEQILRILAQWISNPSSHGHCIGIHGPMGIGKTSLIKEGLSKALDMPFGFIALGGAADGSFLEGHSYTYEGSTYGKIAEILLKTQCSNPVIFFDELDKVSSTKKGEEITGVLTHLTDMTQNEKFNDKYFGEIDINLSRSLIVFSYNDESLINPILKDRMITIEVSGYKKNEKVIIAKDYLLPIIYKNFGLEDTTIVFTKEIIEKVIDIVPEEEGVRNLKRGLECIISWVNMYRYLPEKQIPIPFTITEEFIYKHLFKKDDKATHLHNTMYT